MKSKVGCDNVLLNINKTEKYIEDLRREFEAGDNSFLIKLRLELTWDKVSFANLVSLMQTCCENYESEQKFERWIAEGFWYIPQFIIDWTTHPRFLKKYSKDYYEKAYECLKDLAFYFFIGQHPRIDKQRLDDIFLRIQKRK